MGFEFVIGGILVAVVGVLARSVKIIGQAEVIVVERFGRFHRLARSGLNLLIPFVERPRLLDVRYSESDVSGVKRITASSTARIDLREQVLSFPKQPVITKDNVTIDIDAVIYYRVADPQKATYAVQNLRARNADHAAASLARWSRSDARQPRYDQPAHARGDRGRVDGLGRRRYPC
jgi:regulator of protease activity HflC (stomatin/prohibitin superfamily)